MHAAWRLWTKKADFDALAAKLGIDPVIARLLVNRDVPEDQMAAFLHPSSKDYHDPALLSGAKEAAELLSESIDKKIKIRVIGDYDVDGINATYILKTGIRRCGGDCDAAIPRRIEDGYGINVRMVEDAAAGGVGLLITCDNGIAAADAIGRGRELGMKMIVTDHHAVPFETGADGVRRQLLPEADVVCDPHQNGDTYPYPNICGAVVAWKVITLLYRIRGMDAAEAEVFVENAAFATICDVMPLSGENRSIVTEGLRALSNTKNTGLRALLTRNHLRGERLTAYHCGFILGPQFNAAGRLDQASRALALLECRDEGDAAARAMELVTLNDERKAMTEHGVDQALSIIGEQGLAKDAVLVIYVPGVHESLAGLIAGRLKEKFYRPTIVLTDAEDGGLKGSGRSIEAYSMFEKLHECADLFTKFGGHPMAAGLSMPAENLDELRRRLNEQAGLSQEDLTPQIHLDVPMPLSYLTEDLIRQISLLEPYGTGNPKPLFAEKNLRIRQISRIGANKQYLKFSVLFPGRDGQRHTMDALFFSDAEELETYVRKKCGNDAWDQAEHGEGDGIFLDLCYEPQINEYRGRISLQILIRDYR